MYLRLQTWLYWGVYVRFQGCNRHSISFSTSTYNGLSFITVISWNCRNDWVTTREQTSAGDLLKIWILEERPWKGIRVNHRLPKSTLHKGIPNTVYQIPPKNTPRHFTTRKTSFTKVSVPTPKNKMPQKSWDVLHQHPGESRPFLGRIKRPTRSFQTPNSTRCFFQ